MSEESNGRQVFDEAWANEVLEANSPVREGGAATASATFPVPDTGGEEHGTPLYADVATLLAGGLPDPPTPSFLRRSDGHALFYPGQVNTLYGLPESLKTWILLAGCAEALMDGFNVLFVDLDHNGVHAVVFRLMDMGVDESILVDPHRFRFVEPEDRAHLVAVVADAKAWRPHFAGVDSIGELLPLLRLSSNSPDDFTIAHALVLKPLAMAGAAVVVIDHLSKNPESHGNGPTGTAAKRRAIGGVSLRVTINEQAAPGRAGSAYIAVNKDRHGGLRRHCPPAEGRAEPVAGLFRMDSSGGRIEWSIRAPQVGDAAKLDGVSPADLATLDQLDPPPTSVRDVKARTRWSSQRATDALRVWRSRNTKCVPEEQGTPAEEDRSPFPTPGARNEEHDPQTDQNVVRIGQKDILGGVWEGTPA
ncbi:AAA family ATPase [Lentzea nigeriaca]|uniref:hypothetical protein n=1 Tax=Lentzea nigeriaca TaxID=1128665 RepID=UPI0019583073|nr:hypothetical protein [Lentzea nigeriaca]MBM7860423.1 hypothetical protein [Lentzea nigeriaca]